LVSVEESVLREAFTVQGTNRLMGVFLLVGLVMGGCAADRLVSPASEPGSVEDCSKLAGLWDDEKGIVVVVLFHLLPFTGFDSYAQRPFLG
jgi:hypothetical protein